MRKALTTAGLCVAAAATLGALAALVSLRTTSAPPQASPVDRVAQSPASIPPDSMRATQLVAAPALTVEQRAAAQPAAAQPAAANPIVDDGSQGTAPSCADMIAAHAAPHYKVQPFDYIYLLELRTARRELVRGNIDAAQAALCRALRDPGADTNVWFEYANLLLLRRDGAAAIPWLTKVLELDPKDRRAQILMGDALLRAGRLEDARAAWLKAASARSGDAAAVANLAKGYFTMAEQSERRSDLHTAERLHRRAIALDPNHARARGRLAEILAKLGFVGSAERWAALAE